MQCYIYGEEYVNIARKTSLLEFQYNNKLGKHQFIYHIETFLSSYNCVQVKHKCNFKASYFQEIKINKKNIMTFQVKGL